MAELSQALTSAGLPVSDIGNAGQAFFRLADDEVLGYAGLEGGGADRLIRSVVVLPHRRGRGGGQAIVAMIESVARDLAVERLHLLTTTAAAFFAANGYTVAERSAAPPLIAALIEFTSLCPASAVYMTKTLDA